MAESYEQALAALNQLVSDHSLGLKKGVAQEGAIGVFRISDDVVRVVHLACTSDFVSRNSDFLGLFKHSTQVLPRELNAMVAKFGESIDIVTDALIQAPQDHGLFYHIHRPYLESIGTGVGIVACDRDLPIEPCKLASHVFAMNPHTLYDFDQPDSLMNQRFLFGEGKRVGDLVKREAVSKFWRFGVGT